MLGFKSNNENSSDSLSFWEVLGLIFITLKLTKTISWSWIWVLAPLWGSIALGLGALVLTWVLSKK